MDLLLVKSLTSLVGSYSHGEGIMSHNSLHVPGGRELCHNHPLLVWDLETSGIYIHNKPTSTSGS